jgi:hypothetical protein
VLFFTGHTNSKIKKQECNSLKIRSVTGALKSPFNGCCRRSEQPVLTPLKRPQQGVAGPSVYAAAGRNHASLFIRDAGRHPSKMHFLMDVRNN